MPSVLQANADHEPVRRVPALHHPRLYRFVRRGHAALSRKGTTSGGRNKLPLPTSAYLHLAARLAALTPDDFSSGLQIRCTCESLLSNIGNFSNENASSTNWPNVCHPLPNVANVLPCM